MLILLSCAKIMNRASKMEVPFSTQPIFEKEAARIASHMCEYQTEELSRILKVNHKIAEENRLRFKYFNTPEYPTLEAILSYAGIVFKKLDLSDFTQDDFKYAQDHLRITSFCYGLLRPLDKIHPYRLEGDVTLPALGNITLFEFWRSRLTDQLIQDVKATGGILCNLASGEMKRLFDWPRLEKEVQIITPKFQSWKNGKPVSIVIYTKIARGETARYIIKNKISAIEALHLDELL